MEVLGPFDLIFKAMIYLIVGFFVGMGIIWMLAKIFQFQLSSWYPDLELNTYDLLPWATTFIFSLLGPYMIGQPELFQKFVSVQKSGITGIGSLVLFAALFTLTKQVFQLYIDFHRDQ